MVCLGQQVHRQIVAKHELPRKDLAHLEALREEHDLTDQHHVGHHHRHGPEERLERLGQLGTAGITRVHRNEGHDGLVNRDGLVVEQEGLDVCARAPVAAADAVEHHLVLRGAHGEHLNRDPVELVEASPAASLCETLVDGRHDAIVHLVRAVEHVHHDSERAAQILGGFRLARPCGAGRCAAKDEPRRLRERDVATVRERRDHQRAAVPDVLVGVRLVEIANVDPAVRRLFVDAVAQLRLPLEAVSHLHTRIDQSRDHVAPVDVDGHHRDDLLPVTLRQLAINQIGQVVELRLALVEVVLARIVVAFLELLEHAVDVVGVDDTRDQDAHLCALVNCPLVARLVLVCLVAIGLVPAQARAHPLHDLVEPDLDRTIAQARLVEFHELFRPIDHPQRGLGRRAVLVHLVPNLVDRVEVLGEVLLQQPRRAALGQNVEQVSTRNEVEARERELLGLQVVVQRLLAELQVLEHRVEQLLHAFLLGQLDRVEDLLRFLHQLLPVAVDAVEPLRILWQLHTDIGGTHEDRLEPDPLLLHLLPRRTDGRVDSAELALPLADQVLERLIAGDVLGAAEGLQLHLAVVQRFHQLFGKHEQHDLRLHVRLVHDHQALPHLVDLGQLLLDDELLLRAVDNVRDLILEVVQTEVKQVAQREVVILGEALARRAHQLLPVAFTHRRVGQVGHQRQRSHHVLHRIFAALVAAPVLDEFVHGAHDLREFLALVSQDIRVDVSPLDALVRLERALEHRHHVPARFQMDDIAPAIRNVAERRDRQLE